MKHLSDPELNRIAADLRARYGNELCEILFFGSRARGDYSEDSDYDCLLVFREVTERLELDLDKLVAGWLLQRGIVFSWVAVSQADLERLRYEPFLQNARREGIPL